MIHAQLQKLVPQIKLSGIEQGCLQRLANGMSTEEIASALSISELTVELVLKSAVNKLGARTRDQAIARALRIGLID